MKKIFILLFIALAAGKSFSQQSNISPFPEDFGTGTSFPASFNSVNTINSTFSTDWIIDDASSAPTIPVCNVNSSTGGSKLFGQNAAALNTFQEVRTNAISTNTFVNIQVSWNCLKASLASPFVACEWSKDNGSTWTQVSYINTSGINTWGAVAAVSLPAAANGTVIILRWSYTATGTGGNDYVAIDDVKITGTPSPSFYWNGIGPLNLVSSWGINTNGTGTNPPDFTSNNQNFYIMNAASTTLTGNWTVSGTNSAINVGDGTSTNKIALTIPTTFAITMSGAAVLNVTNASTLIIQNTTFPSVGNINLSTGSTVDFAQSSPVTLWATTYATLKLSGGGSKSQPASNLTVSESFIVASGTNYVMVGSATRTTRLSGPIACTGSITTGISHLIIDGSGAVGTISLTGTGIINNFTFDRAGQTFTAGNTFTVNGITTFNNGEIALNGKMLTLNGAVTFPASASNGSITGSATSSLSIVGSGAITNNLVMNQATAAAKTLNQLIYTRSSNTLALGADLVANTFSFTNGSFDFGGKSFTVTSNATFPSSASNGVFIGSTTASLTISGAGTLNNSLFMDQTNTASKSLGALTVNRTATLVLGNNAIVTGSLSMPIGIIDLNGTLLTLSGDINFPTSNFNRGFKGSTTSSLTIDGSGSIANSLYMNTANDFLGVFTMNRSGATVTLGSTLETYGTVFPNAGTIASAGNLYIRSSSASKGRIAPILGSLTGNIKVETFALGGNTDWAVLGPAGVSGLSVASWEGQIPMSCSLCPNDQQSAGGYFVSIQRWDASLLTSNPATYVEMTYNDALTPGLGYWTFLGTSFPSTPDMTWTVTGPVVKGPLSMPLGCPSPMSVADNFNLISNPFPSPISWASLRNGDNNVDDAIYVYNADLGLTTSYVSGIASNPGNGISDTIPMGQGFYVQAINPTTLTAQESNKISGNKQLLKTTATNTFDIGSIVRLNVAGYNSDGSPAKDATVLRFHGDATVDFDRELDAVKMFSSPGYVGSNGAAYNSRTTISTRTNDMDYSINSLPYANTADAVIPVLIRVNASGQHTITATDLQNMPNSCVQLLDKLDNSTHDLKMAPYVVTISDTTSAPRFELRVCADITMSINENKPAATSGITISTDANGVYVKYDLDKLTKSNIVVTNVLGQKVVDDKHVTVDKDKVYVDIPEKNQVVIVTAITDKVKVAKKIVR